MMEKVISEISDYLAREEEKTIKKFMRIANKSDIWSFNNAGYTITQQKLKSGMDGIMSWRMTLMRRDCEVIHQDIEVILRITME
jgi:hypothetical protein